MFMVSFSEDWLPGISNSVGPKMLCFKGVVTRGKEKLEKFNNPPLQISATNSVKIYISTRTRFSCVNMISDCIRGLCISEKQINFSH